MPNFDEHPGARELDDPVVGVERVVAVGDEHVAVRRHRDVGGHVEGVGALARHAGLAQRQQQFAIRAVLEDLVALAARTLAVGEPEIALAVDGEAVREEKLVGREALDQLPDVSNFSTGASGERSCLPQRSNTHTLQAIRIDIHRRRRTPRAFGWQLPALHQSIRIGQVSGRAAAGRRRRSS